MKQVNPQSLQLSPLQSARLGYCHLNKQIPLSISLIKLPWGLVCKLKVSYTTPLASINRCFYSSRPGGEGWLALKPKGDTSLACRMNWAGVWRRRPCSQSWGSGSETLRPLSVETTKGVVEKPSFNRKPKICACHFVFIWHSSMVVILSSCCCLYLKEAPYPWNGSQLSISHS